MDGDYSGAVVAALIRTAVLSYRIVLRKMFNMNRKSQSIIILSILNYLLLFIQKVNIKMCGSHLHFRCIFAKIVSLYKINLKGIYLEYLCQ